MLEAHREYAIDAVRRIVGDAVDAEDCVHDAMLRLVERDDLDAAHLRSLLTRAATHIAIDRLRRGRSAERATARLAAQLASGAVVSPEQIVADREDVDRALAAVRQLPARERQVMTLRLAGLSVLETARLLGVSVKSVEGAYTRARARVRLIVGAVLAWIAERTRRIASPRGEAFAAVVAALVLLGPFAGNGTAALPHASGHGVLGLAASNPAPGNGVAGAPPRGDGRHLGTLPGGGRTDPASSPGGGGDQKQNYLVNTGPISVPIPDPTSPQRPIFYGGPVQIYVTGVDPVGEIEYCLANGGPAISLSNGGCQPPPS